MLADSGDAAAAHVADAAEVCATAVWVHANGGSALWPACGILFKLAQADESVEALVRSDNSAAVLCKALLAQGFEDVRVARAACACLRKLAAGSDGRLAITAFQRLRRLARCCRR